MRVSEPIRLTIVAALFCAAIPATGWAQSPNLSLSEIVSRLQQAEAESHNRAVAYRVTREYQLSSAGAQQPDSEVLAQVNFVPPGSKDYVIVNSQGSERGTGIVRKVLEQESAMASHRDLHELTLRNYDFALLGRETVDGHDCYVLQLSPKRQAVELIRGRAWVDSKEFAVRKIEGAVAKNPSIWIKNINLTINYADVNGVWLQTATRAIADVRFVGSHVLTSRAVEVQTAAFSAQRQTLPTPAAKQRSNAGHQVANTATWIVR